MNRIKETRNKKGQLHSYNDEPAIIDSDGTKYWYKNGKIHRDNDLPAAINNDGYMAWYINGKPHRDNDEPAVIHNNGYMSWYRNGIRHRETGAAIMRSDGTKEYWLNGEQHPFHEWISMLNLPEENKLEMALKNE